MIKQELNENTKAVTVERIFAWGFFFFCKSGYGIQERISTSSSIYSKADERKSPPVKGLGLHQVWTATTVQLISPPFAQHLLLKTLDPKGKSYFETQSDLTYYFKLHSKSLILTSLLPPDDKGIHRLHSGVAFHPFPLLLISHYPRQLKINKTWSSDGWRSNITKQGHQKSDPTSPKETHHRFF